MAVVEQLGAKVSASSPINRSESRGTGVAGGGIHDSAIGKTCHQCRQKIKHAAATCKNQRNNKPCSLKLCHKCLSNRYGEKAEEVAGLEEWSCPKCRGICNCSVCMKKRGHQPTGALINTAKATGFSSVSEMLLKKRENGTACMVTSLDKEVVFSPRKRGKENSFDRNVDLNSAKSVDKGSKKFKMAALNSNVDDKTSAEMNNQCCDRRDTKEEGLEGIHGCKRNAGVLSNQSGSSDSEKEPKKLKIDKSGEISDGVDLSDCVMETTENISEGILGNDEMIEEGSNPGNVDKPSMNENADFEADLQLPVGAALETVSGIDVPPEDVGNALQFLEFCSTFGKILEVNKGQPEHVLRDLFHRRTGRCGKFSLTIQFHMHLLYILQTEQREECGKNSWFHTLKKCLSGSQRVGCLEKEADYETLSASEKLEVLNLLCDEILGTEKLRNWIDNQNTELAQKVKEAKQKVLVAKNKEKSLKMKMKRDIAEAITARNVASLSISEEEAIVSHTKLEAEHAHAELLSLKDMLSKTTQSCDALRIEPVFMQHSGHVYRKLNCTDKFVLLHQDVGKGDELDEKWYVLDDEDKEVFEKQISSLKGKLKAPGFRNFRN